jgi:hypothetical protein
MPAKKEKPGEEVDIERPNLDMLYGNLSYEELVASSDVDILPGWLLIEDKEDVRGVGFAVVRVTFRPTARNNSEYVSVYAVAKDLGQIVVNDGSTGIRRQIMDYLIAKGIATFMPSLAQDVKGYSADLPFGDLPVGCFDWSDAADVKFGGLPGDQTVDVIFPKPLISKHGVRVSEYDWENPETGKTQKAKTYYLG